MSVLIFCRKPASQSGNATDVPSRRAKLRCGSIKSMVLAAWMVQRARVQRTHTARSTATNTLHKLTAARRTKRDGGVKSIGSDCTSMQPVLLKLVVESPATNTELLGRFLFVALSSAESHQDEFALDVIESHADVDWAGVT